MENNLKAKLPMTSTVIFLSILTLISGFAGILSRVGFLSTPITAALVAAIFVMEEKRLLKFSLPIILVLSDIVLSIILTPSFTAIFAVLIAVIVAIWYKKGYRKSEAVLITTALTTVMLIITIAIVLKIAYGVDSVTSATDAIKTIFEDIKNVVFKNISLAAETNPNINPSLLDEEYHTLLFGLLYQTTPAWVIICAFILSGCAFRIFSSIILRFPGEKDKILTWRFITSPLFAYFYITISVLSLFMISADSIISLSILNLELVFMVVYAYIGYMFATAMLTVKTLRPTYSKFVLLFGIIIFSSIALRVLAIVGAIVTIIHGKIESTKGNLFSQNKLNK